MVRMKENVRSAPAGRVPVTGMRSAPVACVQAAVAGRTDREAPESSRSESGVRVPVKPRRVTTEVVEASSAWFRV